MPFSKLCISNPFSRLVIGIDAQLFIIQAGEKMVKHYHTGLFFYVSNEKDPCCLGYIRGLYYPMMWVFNKPVYH